MAKTPNKKNLWPRRVAEGTHLALSPPDSDGGTERSEARTGGRRSAARAQRSEEKQSEPDGVRVLAHGHYGGSRRL